MMMSPGSGDLTLEVTYGPGDGNSVETYLTVHANQGLKVYGKDVGTSIRLTIFGEWERSALHEIIDSKCTRAAAENHEKYLRTQLEAVQTFDPYGSDF